MIQVGYEYTWKEIKQIWQKAGYQPLTLSKEYTDVHGIILSIL